MVYRFFEVSDFLSHFDPVSPPSPEALAGRPDYIRSACELAADLWRKDSATFLHGRRVAGLCEEMAVLRGFSEEDQAFLYVAAFFHDIGKLRIEDRLLQTQRVFSAHDRQAMQAHPVIGWQLLARIPELEPAALPVRHHHERMDGTGYPDCLSGSAIPPASRFISVADAYDAMTTRTYKGRRSRTDALREIRRQIGSQFHSEAAGSFLETLDLMP